MDRSLILLVEVVCENLLQRVIDVEELRLARDQSLRESICRAISKGYCLNSLHSIFLNPVCTKWLIGKPVISFDDERPFQDFGHIAEDCEGFEPRALSKTVRFRRDFMI